MVMESSRFLSEIFPDEHADFSWIPEGMDPNSSYRFAARVGAFVKLTEDGKREYCDACNIAKVLDRDTTNWDDLFLHIGTQIKIDSKHKLRVTYWDNMSRSYEEIDSDNKLLHAIDMYWEIRRLSVQVRVMIKDNFSLELDIGREQSMPCVLQGSTDAPADQLIAQPTLEIASSLVDSPVQNNPEVNWVDDDVEYVGLDDEDPYKTLLSDDESDGDVGDDECVSLEDDLLVEDAQDCETIVHATDLENPTIEVGVTFGDGDTFKKAIRQYAIKGEYEIAAAYSESTRYRGYCKAERCNWRIHASQLQDGMTWKIKKIPHVHTCQGTGQVENNCMATNHWVKDRVLPWLATDPTIGAKELKKKLELHYRLQLSYYVVWDGRKMALDQLKGKWDDSFEHAFSFKAEVEKTNPGSLVDIEYEQVGKKMRFTRMFVALKACVDGFLNGCRPFLGVDSTHLTGKWKGQLASATSIDGHMAKTCNEYVYDSDAPPPAAPKPKRKRGNKSVTIVPSSAVEPPQEQLPSCVDSFATPTRPITCSNTPSPITRSMTRRLLELESSTPTRVTSSVSTPSPMTRGRKRLLELEDAIEPVGCPIISPFCVETGKPKKLQVVRSKKS